MKTPIPKRFNLIDEPWLPVRLHDGEIVEWGLLELFQKADAIHSLAETSPPSLIAEYRLLLAITHRALSAKVGTWKDKDRAHWFQHGLPEGALAEYLEHWRDRFWVFHPEFPFMQVAALEGAPELKGRHKPWTQVSLASATGDTPVMFDHAIDSTPTDIPIELALRHLLGFLQFVPGGTVRVLRDVEKAGPLSNTAAVLPLGENLRQTLCLALHPAPMGTHQDLPNWEQAAATLERIKSEPTLATGPNDRYTRLTRAVLLQPKSASHICTLRFAAGLALEDDAHAPDPMASYRMGKDQLIRLGFTEGRAFWRELPSLLPVEPGKASHRAAVLGYASNLQSAMSFDSVYQPLLVAGLASHQAKLLRWRQEQIVLPAALLQSWDKAHALAVLLQLAETEFKAFRDVAQSLLTQTLPTPDNKDTRARARNLFEAGAAMAVFFGQTERSLAAVMQKVAQDDYPAAERLWHQALRQALERSWTEVRRSIGQGPSALRADAQCWPRFQGLLRAHLQ